MQPGSVLGRRTEGRGAAPSQDHSTPPGALAVACRFKGWTWVGEAAEETTKRRSALDRGAAGCLRHLEL